MTLQKFQDQGLKLLESSVVNNQALRVSLPMVNPGLLLVAVILAKVVVAVVLLEVLPEQGTQEAINSL